MKKLLTIFSISILASCSTSEGPVTNAQVVGRYTLHYDAATGTAKYEPTIDRTQGGQSTAQGVHGLNYSDSTGVYDCAIQDTSKTVYDVNYCMGLLDPDSCAVDYNATTHVLSFYAKLVNKSNYADNGSPYTYTAPATYAPNTTYYAPFQYVLGGISWDFGTYSRLVTAVNTNLVSAECGANGLTLTNDDLTGPSGIPDGKYDCIYPNQTVRTGNDPGWDFSPYVPSGVMAPGADSGCVLFMQYTLLHNASFSIDFDLLATKSSGSPPVTPTVTTPTNGAYVNTSSISVTGTGCTPTTGTVYVEGGSSASPPSAVCTGGGTFSVSTPLKLNQENTLIIYQVVAGQQSAPVVRTVTHDNVAPTLVSWSPASGETNVGLTQPCVATFSETMNPASFVTGSGTNNSSCNSMNFGTCRTSGSRRIAGTLTYSNDQTQFAYTPSANMGASTAHTCNAKVNSSGIATTLKDLAGNALNPTSTITFTTGAAGQDLSRPYVKSILPADNATVATSSSFYVYFSEPVQAASLTETGCSTNGDIPNIAIWQTNACVTSGYPPSRPNPITGTLSLNLAGDIATFTPSTALQNSDCLSITVSACVRDLAGNTLPSRGSFQIGAYNDTLSYNSWNIFYTQNSSDTTPPVVSHIAPILDYASAPRRVFPIVVFSEPMNADTIITDYMYTTVFGSTTKISGSLQQDASLQVVTIKPSAAYAASTAHVITVTGNVTDASANLMAAPQTSNFTTVAGADATAPTVVSVSPTNGSSVSRCTTVDVNFSEPMDPTTLNGANVRLVRVSTGLAVPVDLQIADNNQSVRITPDSSLTSTATYRPTISGVKDRSGNTIAATYNATTFTATTDGTAPTVTHFVPANGATVPQNGSFAVFFSEAMDRSTLTNANFSFGGMCSFQSVFPSTDGRSAVVNCYHNMTSGAGKTLTLSGSSIEDRYVGTDGGNCENAGGNTMASNPSITFTVSASSDFTAPTVSSVFPADLATGVSTAAQPSITFSEALDPRTVSATSIFLVDAASNVVNATLSLDSAATTVTLTPVQALPAGLYYVIATTALRDLGGANAYDGDGGESSSIPGILRTCFATSGAGATCP